MAAERHRKSQGRTVAPESELPQVPARGMTKHGVEVDLTGEIWRLPNARAGGAVVTLNFELLQKPNRDPIGQASASALHILKLYVAHHLASKSPMSLGNDRDTVGRLLNFLSARADSLGVDSSRRFEFGVLTEAVLRAFLEYGLTNTASQGNDFSRLRTFYRWGTRTGLPGFNQSLAAALQSITAGGNAKGQATRSRDPVKGPLAPDERDAVVAAIQAEAGDSRDRAVVLLHLELGLNPHASVRIRKGGLIRYEARIVGSDGHPKLAVYHQIRVPRVKKRRASSSPKTRPISQLLASLLEPLATGDPEALLFDWLDGYISPENAMTTAMQRFAAAADLVSPRTGIRMRLTPRRFRYTLGTEMANEGHSLEKIAVVLDHTDTQNAKVYIESSPNVIAHLGGLDALYDRVARWFGGTTVEPEAERHPAGAERKVIPGRAPQLPMLNVGGIGLCGRKDLCRLAPPLTCYTCDFFAAFTDGPHAEVVSSMEEYMDETFRTGAADARIPLQLARAVAAGRQLLVQLEDRRERGGEA